jgi:hypothetical protein
LTRAPVPKAHKKNNPHLQPSTRGVSQARRRQNPSRLYLLNNPAICSIAGRRRRRQNIELRLPASSPHRQQQSSSLAAAATGVCSSGGQPLQLRQTIAAPAAARQLRLTTPAPAPTAPSPPPAASVSLPCSRRYRRLQLRRRTIVALMADHCSSRDGPLQLTRRTADDRR